MATFSIKITSSNGIELDGKPINLSVTQAREGTIVYRPENRISGVLYVEYKMPHQRYSLAHDRPASGNPGRAQFENDIRALWASIQDGILTSNHS